MFLYIGPVLVLIITLLICFLVFPQYWGGKANENMVVENLDNSCGISAVDDVQTVRTQLQQDEFAAIENNCKRKGVYLDIGAYHPTDLSNTYLLEKRLNWSGFCVEPFPKGDFKDRKCKLDKIVLASSNSPVIFDKHNAASSFLGGISKFMHPINAGKSQGEKVEVIPETPMQYFKRVKMPKVIDYLTIDVEGAENDILGAIDWNNFCARALTVEHNEVKEAKERTIEILTTKSKCKLVKTFKHDDFFKCDC